MLFLFFFFFLSIFQLVLSFQTSYSLRVICLKSLCSARTHPAVKPQSPLRSIFLKKVLQPPLQKRRRIIQIAVSNSLLNLRST